MAQTRERYLDKYRDEIIMLVRERRYTPVRIRNYLENKYGIEVPKSTLSVFMKTLPPMDPVPNVPPEAEHFLEQYEVYQSITDGIKTTQDLAVNLHARMAELENAAAARHQALVETLQRLIEIIPQDTAARQRHETITKGLQQIYDALPTNGQEESLHSAIAAIRAATQGLESPPDIRPTLTAIQESLRRQAGDIAAIRRSVGPVWGMVQRNAPWLKAFALTGLFWLAVIAGVMWYYNLWRFLPWKAWPLR